MKQKMNLLDELADIHPGYPFRGKLPLDKAGDAYVVQFRNATLGQTLSDPEGRSLDRVNLTGRRRPNFLQPGDVIFMAKGTRNDAVVIGDLPGSTVCTPNFYHIRLNAAAHSLMPEFLTWQINHVSAQRYFATCSQGSVAPSITKSQLASLPVIIPPIEKQKLIVSLAGAAAKEQKLMEQLIENRQRMLNAVGERILHPEQVTGN